MAKRSKTSSNDENDDLDNEPTDLEIPDDVQSNKSNRPGNEPPDWNFLIRLSTVAVYVTTVFIGIYQFNYEQQKNTELEYKRIRINDSINFENSMWSKKLEVYTSLGRSIGRIISLGENDSIPKNLVREFEELYYGEAILVEDTIVSKGLTHFRRSIYDYRSGFISTYQLKEIGIHLAEDLKVGIQKRRK
jgi:hypothetical protein